MRRARATQTQSPSHKRDERQLVPPIHKRDERQLAPLIHKRDERQLAPLIHKRDERQFLRTNPLFSYESLQRRTSCQFHYLALSFLNEIFKEDPWFNIFANVHAVHWNDFRVWRLRAATTH